MMYVLDTNIFSEVIKANANENVQTQFTLNKPYIFVASTVWQEMLYGVLIMPDGRKKQEIMAYVQQGVSQFPVLNYDKICADIHAKIRADARKAGKSLAFADSQIASIALAHDAVLVTRNVNDFLGINGLQVENWFE